MMMTGKIKTVTGAAFTKAPQPLAILHICTRPMMGSMPRTSAAYAKCTGTYGGKMHRYVWWEFLAECIALYRGRSWSYN
jgi:hypothetical protein